MDLLAQGIPDLHGRMDTTPGQESAIRAEGAHPSRPRADRDGDTAGDAAYRVGGGDSLIACGYERPPTREGVHAVVAAHAGGERVVSGQRHAGVGVGSCERHGAVVVDVVEEITV
jgi:hypothetical protein